MSRSLLWNGSHLPVLLARAKVAEFECADVALLRRRTPANLQRDVQRGMICHPKVRDTERRALSGQCCSLQ